MSKDAANERLGLQLWFIDEQLLEEMVMRWRQQREHVLLLAMQRYITWVPRMRFCMSNLREDKKEEEKRPHTVLLLEGLEELIHDH